MENPDRDKAYRAQRCALVALSQRPERLIGFRNGSRHRIQGEKRTVMGRLGKTTAEYLAEVEENGLALRYVPLSRRTRTICLAAVRSNGLALQHVPVNMRSDIVLCLDAVDSAGMALEFVPEALRGRELCFDAVHSDGCALQFVPEELRDEDMCAEALESCPKALRDVPLSLRASLAGQASGSASLPSSGRLH